MNLKKIIFLLACAWVIPCFAARCLTCGRNLIMADADTVCNLCLAKDYMRYRSTVATWEINYNSKLKKPDIKYIIYSAKDSLENRKDAVYISVENKLHQIHNVNWAVGKYVLKMPQKNNPERVNVCLFYQREINNRFTAISMFTLTNMPLTVKEYNYLQIEVGIQNNDNLRVDVFGGQDKYGSFTHLGGGSIAPGKKLDCSSV